MVSAYALIFPYFYTNADALYTFSILLLLVGFAIATVAQIRVKSTFSRYSRVTSGLTGEQAARLLLQQNGISGVAIVPCSGRLTDHFDPRNNTIYLSEEVFAANTVAAVGVACHEAGHAVQYAHGYFPLRLRNAIIPATNLGSSLAMPLVLIGLIFSFYPLAMLGVLLFGLAVLFQLITLPVEFNASARAVQTIAAGNLLERENRAGVKAVLGAAAMTYVGALVVSLAQFLRLLAIVGGRNNRR